MVCIGLESLGVSFVEDFSVGGVFAESAPEFGYLNETSYFSTRGLSSIHVVASWRIEQDIRIHSGSLQKIRRSLERCFYGSEGPRR